MKQSCHLLWILGGIAVYCLSPSSPTVAQIVPDGTLPDNSIVTPQGNTTLITGGTVAGTNLFHSFEQFSLSTGSTAFFNNPLTIQNIISRVTSGLGSNIDGLIRANGIANLFLINPNGIIFGSNARLDIGGSFLASTASSLNFADGTRFSATATQTTPLLTISVPIGLQFGETARPIVVQGSGNTLSLDPDSFAFVRGENPVGLMVQPGKTLALVGALVTLESGNLIAQSGRIEVGSVASPGQVSLTPTDFGWSLGYSGVATFGDIQLSGRASIDASSIRPVSTEEVGSGDIQVQGRRVILEDGSAIFAPNSGSNPGGTLVVNASDSVELIGTSVDGFPSALFTDTQSAGAAGNLTINTRVLIVRDGAEVTSDTSSTGNGGNVTVNAGDSVQLIGTSAVNELISGLFATGDTGDAGNLTINTPLLIVRDGAAASTFTSGSGNAGSLTVNASESVQLIGTSVNGFASALSTQTLGNGNAGELTINTRSLIVRDGAFASTFTSGLGDAGSLTVNATDKVELIGTSVNEFPSALSTQTLGNGNAGELTINTRSLIVRDGAFASTSTSGSGNAGSLTVNATNKVELIGTSVNGFASSLSTQTSGDGNAGELTINTRSLIVRDGAFVSTATFGIGSGNTLTVNASDLVELAGTSTFNTSGLFTSVQEEASGTAGNLTVTTRRLIIRDGARITASSVSTASDAKGAGNINITARTIRLENQGAIAAETASGNGGDITLENVDLLVLRRGSRISTTAGTQQAGGDGGNITINAKNGFIVAVPGENSDITANAFSGSGGSVTIDATNIFGIAPLSRRDLERLLGRSSDLDPGQLPTNDITAISQENPSLSDRVTINAPDVESNQGLLQLPTGIIDASTLIASGCSAFAGTEGSTFFVTGRGGLPPSPDEPLSSDVVWSDTRVPATTALHPSSKSPAALPLSQADVVAIVPATGWVFNQKGEVTLISHASNATTLESTRCYQP